MRRYDDEVEVRRGVVTGVEAPEQFLWRGRLWKVRAVLAHWVETGPWWHSDGVQEVLGADEPSTGGPDGAPGPRPLSDLMSERELWRVEAGRGMARADPDGSPDRGGVFDLSFDWADGSWQLLGCED